MTLTVIFAFKQLAFAAFLFRLLDLVQVHVDEIAWLISTVQRLAVVVDHFAVKVEHLLAVAFDLVLGVDHAGQVLDRGQVLDHQHFAEQAHALLDQEHEALEQGVVFGEAHRHQQVADDVGGGDREGGRNVDGGAVRRLDLLQEDVDFRLVKGRRWEGPDELEHLAN